MHCLGLRNIELMNHPKSSIKKQKGLPAEEGLFVFFKNKKPETRNSLFFNYFLRIFFVSICIKNF